MTKRYLVLVTAALLLASAFAVGCGDDDGGSGTESPGVVESPTPRPTGPFEEKAVTTLPLFAHWMHIVGDGRIDIYTVVPPGVPPHGLTPSDVDLSALGDEALVLYNGAGLEAGFEDALFENKRRGSQIIPYSHDISSPSDPDESVHFAGDNPHLWLDPVFARTHLDTTWDSFAIIDGEGTSTYRSNAREYQAELEALHEEIGETLDAVPESARRLITHHDAFGYFAGRYGFEVAGVATEDDAADLVQLIEDEGIPAVFAEYGFDDAAITSIAEEADVEVCLLYSDAMGGDVNSYIEMMRHNAEEIARCLGPG